MERREAIYHGDVQGVGFRQATRTVARQHPVAGFVRNLANGTVQVVVEGEERAVDAFLAAVARRMGHHIHDVDVTSLPARGEFDGFDVRY